MAIPKEFLVLQELAVSLEII